LGVIQQTGVQLERLWQRLHQGALFLLGAIPVSELVKCSINFRGTFLYKLNYLN